MRAPFFVVAGSVVAALGSLVSTDNPPWAAQGPGTSRTVSGSRFESDSGPLLVEGSPEWPVGGTSACESFDTTTAATQQVIPLDAAFPSIPDWSAGERGGGEEPATCGSCITGDLFEGEPTCSNGYIDATNGGCNFNPNVFGAISCGQTVCGTYGTFLTSGGQNFRDTDWYRFTITQTSNVTWTATGDARTRVFILQGNCPASSLGTAVADACLPATVTLNSLPAGTYNAFVGTDAFSGVPCGTAYRAKLTVTNCCAIDAQPGDRPEGEPTCSNGYVDATNGGCNFNPNVFGSIACGETVFGTYGTFLTSGGQNFRDTDWYKFTLPTATQVTWTATGEARTRIFILEGNCPANSLGTAVAAACTTATLTLNLPAGTYNAFVGTDAFTGVPCGSRYRATLSTGACAVGPCRVSDVTEGEPTCANGYIDATNGGCNFNPNVFGAISCGQTVCGTYGTFLTSGGQNFRDTDWYKFTITQTSNVTWTAIGDARTRLFILQGNCPASSLGTAVGDAGTPVTLTINNLPAGTYNAFVGTDAFSGVPCGSRYRATLLTQACCLVPPQQGDRIEGEPVCFNGAVDTYNGGCNSNPVISGSIECGETIAGTYGTYLTSGGQNFRDTDWYRFTLSQDQTVTWTATGSARTRVFILRDQCPASSLATAVADPCQPATITMNLAAGSYYGFVGTDAFSGLGCGLGYRVTLLAEKCQCPADFDGDGFITGIDYDLYVQAFEAGDGSADFDGDGFITGIDFDLYVLAYESGC